jgi:aspartate racemase
VTTSVVGIVGGIGPESTIAYYRAIVAKVRARNENAAYPRIIINSIDASAMLALIPQRRFDELATMLAREVDALGRAGADFALIAAGTPHLVFDDVRARTSVPLISIVEATRDAAVDLGLHRLALLGTRFTMDATFYADALGSAGIEVVAPSENDRAYVHQKYMTDLFSGDIPQSTREGITAVVERMIAVDHVDGVIVGGTELFPLVEDFRRLGTAVLDTADIHAEAAVDRVAALETPESRVPSP